MTESSASNDRAPPAAASPPNKPQRNSVERAIVWSVIGLGVVVICVEAFARFSYSTSVDRLQKAIQAVEASSEMDPVLIEQVPALLAGSPSEVRDPGAYDGVAHYRWNGLIKHYGLHVSYRLTSGIVTTFVTDEPPPEEAPAAISKGESPSAAGEPMGEGERRGGAGGGRPNFDPMQFDADGDGKLSLEEAPERMRETFAESDLNGDGFLDAEELAARRARRGSRGRPGGDAAGPAPAAGEGPVVMPRRRPVAETPTDETAPIKTVPAADDAPVAPPREGLPGDASSPPPVAEPGEGNEAAAPAGETVPAPASAPQ